MGEDPRSDVGEQVSPLSPIDIAPSLAGFLRSQVARPSGLVGSLLLNGAAPFAAYQLLTRSGVAPVRALTLTSAFPVAGLLLAWLRTRRADGIALLSLVLIVIGVAGSLVTNSPRFYLVRVSFGTAAFGLVCLSSLLWKRPLLFYLGRQTVASDGARAEYFSSMWAYARFRHVQRVLTATWGVGYLLEATARVLIALRLPTSTVLLVEPLLGYAVFVALLAWSVLYARAEARAAPSGDRARASAS